MNWNLKFLISLSLSLAFILCLGFPGSSDGKASDDSAGDLGARPGREDPLEKEMANHSSSHAWKIPWTKEPGGLQSMGSQKTERTFQTGLSN